jgi:hypothetical protein
MNQIFQIFDRISRHEPALTFHQLFGGGASILASRISMVGRCCADATGIWRSMPVKNHEIAKRTQNPIDFIGDREKKRTQIEPK